MSGKEPYIDQIMDDGGGTPSEETQEPQDETTPSEETTEDSAAEGEGEADSGAEQGDGEGAPTDKPREPTQRRESKGDRGRRDKGDRSPKPGDLLGPNGEVIARAGAERRLYERAFNDARGRITPIFEKMNREVESLRAQVATHQEYGTLSRELKLNPTEQSLGLKLIAAYRQDPNATINYLLTEAKANGHNVTIGNQSGIDATAISSMIDKKLEPFTSQHRERQEFNQAKDKATDEYNEFMAQNPGARVHENEIAHLIQRFPHLSLESAYLRLENWMYQNGFDTTKPLPPQVTALNAVRAAQARVPRRPLTNGRTPPGLATTAEAANGAMASIDENYGEIVRRVMKHLVAQ